MNATRISPRHLLSDFAPADLLQLETRVRLYEDRVAGWLLRPAKVLIDMGGQDGDFAALTLITTYFEPSEILRSGQGSKHHSEDFFVRGFLDVFRGTVDAHGGGVPPGFKEKLAHLLYEQVRCGLFHQGATGYRIALVRGAHPIAAHTKIRGIGASPTHWQVALVQIDATRWLSQIEDHLAHHVAQLRDTVETDARDKFMRGWEILHAPR